MLYCLNTHKRKGAGMDKLLLFDLDGTLLTTDKKISPKTFSAVMRARENGYLIGICTSRSEGNSLDFIGRLQPDVTISSGGAMVSLRGEVIVTDAFTSGQTHRILSEAKRICSDISISLDSASADAEFYSNFKPPEDALSASWGKTIYTDVIDFYKPALKICFEIFDKDKAEELQDALPFCDCIKFSDGEWYKFTKSGVTKETAIKKTCVHLGIDLTQVTAFGDDLADIGMLRMCGTGVAMGNALPEVKAASDITIGSNDEDGIAYYLDSLIG